MIGGMRHARLSLVRAACPKARSSAPESAAGWPDVAGVAAMAAKKAQSSPSRSPIMREHKERGKSEFVRPSRWLNDTDTKTKFLMHAAQILLHATHEHARAIVQQHLRAIGICIKVQCTARDLGVLLVGGSSRRTRLQRHRLQGGQETRLLSSDGHTSALLCPIKK